MQSDFYRAVWRWHFYAGLIALPFLLWLAVTGGMYLFKPEIERALYRDMIVLSGPTQAMNGSAMVSTVERQTAGAVTQVIRPESTSESWQMRVETAGGPRTAFVEPASGEVLGTTAEGGFMKLVRDLHGLAITGPVGNALVEIAAGWAIILVVTGFYLWWPRNGQPAIALRGSSKQRKFWRDLHASTGLIGGAVVLFLATTGMPWSGVWGNRVQQFVTVQGWGRPPAPASSPGQHGPETAQPEHHEGAGSSAGADRARVESLPWSLQARPEPVSSHGAHALGLSDALRISAQRDMGQAITVNLPRKAGQPISISRKVEKAADARVLYIDASSGEVLRDNRYADFGAGGKVIDWGVTTHQGLEFGEINRWVMLAGCISVVLLVISAPVLWWKRRVNGHLRRPPAPRDAAKMKVVTILVVIGGILFPLTGLTIALAALLDWGIGRARKPAAT